jgi:electron transfer flavoprotein beta subunit
VVEIVVCVKQVPDASEVEIDPEKGTLIRDGVAATINPFDLYAVEEAIKLKEAVGGSVTALSMGPPKAEATLRDAIALGCDRAILITDSSFAGSDTLATSYALAAAIRRITPLDLVICGLKTTDGDTGQVGPGIAEELDVPHVSYVRRVVSVDEGGVILERTLDEKIETVRSKTPLLITVTKEANEPRLPSFKGKMAARKAEITTWGPSDLDVEAGRLGSEGSPTWVVKVCHPETERHGEMIDGTRAEQAHTIIERLKERNLV